MAVFIALGANQDSVFDGKSLSPPITFQYVLKILANEDVSIKSVSHIWQSPAWPDPDAQPAYQNAVVKVETLHPAGFLLKMLKSIEYSFGRRLSARNAPRPLDIDILDYNGDIISKPGLTLPHPRMLERAFVLLPLQEVAPEWHDPQKNRPIQDWIARLSLSDVEPMQRLGNISF